MSRTLLKDISSEPLEKKSVGAMSADRTATGTKRRARCTRGRDLYLVHEHNER